MKPRNWLTEYWASLSGLPDHQRYEQMARVCDGEAKQQERMGRRALADQWAQAAAWWRGMARTEAA